MFLRFDIENKIGYFEYHFRYQGIEIYMYTKIPINRSYGLYGSTAPIFAKKNSFQKFLKQKQTEEKKLLNCFAYLLPIYYI